MKYLGLNKIIRNSCVAKSKPSNDGSKNISVLQEL